MFKKSILALCIMSLVMVGLPFSAQAGVVNDVLMQTLGKALFQDKNLSKKKNQSCQSCHHPSAAFADPDNVADGTPVSDGSFRDRFGGRNAPTAAYASFSPRLHWDGELYIGGIFWDGRASGLDTSATAGLGSGPTYDPLSDQAKGPFLNTLEMAMGSELEVVKAVRKANYAWLYQIVFPGVLYNSAKVGEAYNNIAIAIAAFERSIVVNRFNSKFDKFVKEQGGDVSTFGVEVQDDGFRKYVGPPTGFRSRYFSYKEADGLALFNADSYSQLDLPVAGPNGAMCYLCHITERHDATAYGGNDLQGRNPFSADGTYNPILTDFSYDNLGIPKSEDPLLAGNPVDFGLGDWTRVEELNLLNTVALDENGNAADEKGKFKVSSLRNIADTAPYAHNGFFATLEEIVHFYNTRDYPWAGESFGEPEVPETMNSGELGNIGLTADQEAKVVAFLKTLSD
jgi:cytochrome c peroxidase